MRFLVIWLIKGFKIKSENMYIIPLVRLLQLPLARSSQMRMSSESVNLTPECMCFRN